MGTRNTIVVVLCLAAIAVALSITASCKRNEPQQEVSSGEPVQIVGLDGQGLYETMCLPCHVTQCDAPGDISGKGLPEQLVTEAIMWGSGGMAGFYDTFTAEQRSLIVDYVVGKAEPPPEIADAGPEAYLYWDKCSGCHGVERQGGTGPALVPQRLESTGRDVLKGIIADGRPGTAMPPWEGVLTDTQMDDLVEYILSPVEESVLTWGIDDMCANCQEVTPLDQLPVAPTWGGRVEDLMVVTEREIGRLLFVDSSTHTVVGEIEAGYAIHAPTFTPGAVSDRWLFAIARNGWLIKVDLYSLEEVGRIRVGLDSRGTAISTDGKYIMVGNFIPNTAVILDAATLKPLKVIEASGTDPSGQFVKSRVAAVLSTPVGPYFEFALKEAGQVWVVDYSREDFPLVKQITDVGNILHDGFLTPDGRYFQVASQADGTIVVIDLQELTIVRKIPAGKQPHPGPGAIFESQGRILAATPAIGEGLITIWDTATWEVVKTIPTPGPGMFIRSHPDNPYVWVDCAASSDSWDNIVVFDRETLEIVTTLQPGKRAIHPEFTPDGKHVYIGCWNEDRIIVYDAYSFEQVAEFAATTPTAVFSAGIRQTEPGA